MSVGLWTDVEGDPRARQGAFTTPDDPPPCRGRCSRSSLCCLDRLMCADECRPADGFDPYPRLRDIRSAVGQPADQMPSGAQPFDWDFLLDYILDPDEQVIPVVGRELLWVKSDGGQIALEQYLARALVGALGVDPNGLPDPPELSDAVLHCLDALGAQQRPGSTPSSRFSRRTLASPSRRPCASSPRSRTSSSSSASPSTPSCAAPWTRSVSAVRPTPAASRMPPPPNPRTCREGSRISPPPRLPPFRARRRNPGLRGHGRGPPGVRLLTPVRAPARAPVRRAAGQSPADPGLRFRGLAGALPGAGARHPAPA